MDTALVVLVALLVGAVALAFYMDWLGLWVSKEEMREQIARSKERMRGSGTPTGNAALGPGDKAREGAATVAFGRAVAFDLDASSLVSLGEAVPGWEIEVVNGATAASLSGAWDPGPVDLLVVGARANVAETLGLCRFLAFCTSYSGDSRKEVAEGAGRPGDGEGQAPRADAPLLVLVPPGQEALVAAALEAGAHSCLVLPIYAKEVASMLVHARAGNQPGRHTLNLEAAQSENRWRDDGGQG